ncbi:MAG: methyltransferase domain-containing protein [Acidobacteria bacterium]|nr:methyltransferase domain-containing protein [Acidobacteriota bacterium]
MALFGRREGEPSRAGGDTQPSAARVPSKIVAAMLATYRRRSTAGEQPRVLLAGPMSQQTLDTVIGVGCRLTVGGEFLVETPLEYPDAAFDLVLGADLLDLMGDPAARALAAEWARVLRSGGRLYLIARREEKQVPPFVRTDIYPDGAVVLQPLPTHHASVHPRQNREFQEIVRPLKVDEIFLRRDGLREIVCRKA